LDSGIWLGLFTQAKSAAIEFGAESIETRIQLEYDPDVFKDVLKKIGLERKAGRIEYKCDIDKLPDETGTPLTWKTAKDLAWNPEQIAEFTKAITEGALDVNPDENPMDFVQDWLQHHEFTSGPDCIAIGFHENQACALVVAQINQQTGWSRISYMGLAPTFRGKGFGKWVHRHGFTMMRQQGGKLYHGGTHINNLAMRKLFESHGCYVFSEMEEWSCHLKKRLS
jgi:RimJ/RimL family protein N-acetyltransferase